MKYASTRMAVLLQYDNGTNMAYLYGEGNAGLRLTRFINRVKDNPNIKLVFKADILHMEFNKETFHPLIDIGIILDKNNADGALYRIALGIEDGKKAKTKQ